ncbi:Positive regulator of purine utilization [Colletotrichum fructicola]|nr:Positive regulator of purine utilization [Colletotrichum fructicola]
MYETSPTMEQAQQWPMQQPLPTPIDQSSHNEQDIYDDQELIVDTEGLPQLDTIEADPGIEDAVHEDETIPVDNHPTVQSSATENTTSLSPSASTEIGPSEPLAHEVGMLSLANSKESKYLGPSSGVPFARLIFSAIPQSQGFTSDGVVQNLELKYHHCIMLLYRPSPAITRPSFDCWKICYESAVATILINSELHRFSKLSNSWLTAHTVFVSGITFLYCLWVVPKIKQETSLVAFKSNADACSNLLKYLAKTWSVAADAVLKYERLVYLTTESWKAAANRPPSAEVAAGQSLVSMAQGQETEASEITSAPVMDPSLYTMDANMGMGGESEADSFFNELVLYQEIDPPVIAGNVKPKKPGGYKDSGADIAYNLSLSSEVQVLSPNPRPDPLKDADWCFPDNEDGILSAIDQGATHLWANTILFASHPLQTSARIRKHEKKIKVIGQGPLIVEKYDDKDFVNTLLRQQGSFTMPWACTIHANKDTPDYTSYPYPVVAKPARGRGSHGVKVCQDENELSSHIKLLKSEGTNAIIVEEFLAGEEATVTVMPPTFDKGYWSLPVVTRFNHQDGIAPYNGTVAVTANSKAVVGSEDPAYEEVAKECEKVGKLLGTTAPIRIDVRRFKAGSKFALFDVNMKPNMTGPGRPGRDEQASLTLLAAAALGWDYKELLRQILGTSYTLEALRKLAPRT